MPTARQSYHTDCGDSDDSSTEVLSGDLREGQEVITGILTVAKRPSSAPPGFGQQRPF